MADLWVWGHRLWYGWAQSHHFDSTVQVDLWPRWPEMAYGSLQDSILISIPTLQRYNAYKPMPIIPCQETTQYLLTVILIIFCPTQPQVMFDQHQSMNCFGLQTCMMQQNRIMPSRKYALHGHRRTWGTFKMLHTAKSKLLHLPGIVSKSWASLYRQGNCVRHSTHHWRGLTASQSSHWSLKYSTSSSRSIGSSLLYLKVKFTFEGKRFNAEELIWVCSMEAHCMVVSLSLA